MRGELAQPIYLGILGKLNAMRASGSQEMAVLAETWQPAVLSHRPAGEYTGLPCAACGQPWPCRLLVDLARDLH